MVFITLILFVAAVILSELLRPKPKIENAKPTGDFNFPTATEDRKVPLCWGRVRVKGPNVVWYGDVRQDPITNKTSTGLWSSVRVITGFRYRVAVQMAICRGPGAVLKRAFIGEDEVFTGTISGPEGRFDIDDLDLFGGDTLGTGGFQATVDFYSGEKTQPISAFLNVSTRQRITTAITPTAPRYTGTCYVVVRELTSAAPTAADAGAYVGNSKSMAAWSWEIERMPALFSGQTAGENVIASTDANPMNVLYELLTNTEWGFGYAASTIDTGASSSFLKASDNLITEVNGFSMFLDREISGSEMLNIIQEQIDGVVFLDHESGKWTIQLARGPTDANFGYNIATVDQFDDASIKSLQDFTRGAWEDTTNQIEVAFDKRDDDYKGSFALAQDMANAIILGGGSVTDPRTSSGVIRMPGVKTGALAAILAWRELKGQSRPLARGKFVTTRKFWNLKIGGVFAWTDPRKGFVQKAMRVTKIDYGTLQENQMVVTAVEDVFAFSAASMGAPPATQWVPPITALIAYPAAEQIAFEAPRALIVRDPLFTGSIQQAKVWAGVRRQGGEVTVELSESHDPVTPDSTFRDAGTVAAFLRIGQLDAALGTGTATPTAAITLNAAPDAQAVLEAIFDDATTIQDMGLNLAQLVLVGDEFMLVSAASLNGADVDLTNVYRGALDSAQANHAINTDVFMLFEGGGLTDTFFSGTDRVDIRLRMQSSSTTFAGTVTTIALTMADRVQRPYTPGSASYNGSASFFNTPALEGDGAGLNGVGFDIDWRRRRFDTGDEVLELLSDFAPDASTEYRVTVFVDPSGSNDQAHQSAWVTGTGPITPTQAELVTFAAAGTEIRIQIAARHDLNSFIDVESRQNLIHDVVPTSARSSQFYLGGNLGITTPTNTYTVASATIHNVTIGAAYGSSNVQESINGAGFTNVITAGGTTATLNGGVALSVSDTVRLQHTVSESPDPQFVEIDDGTIDVAYGAFSA